MTRLAKVADKNGHNLQTNMTCQSVLPRSSMPVATPLKFEYDALDRPMKTISAENHISSIDQYDGNSNIIKARDTNAHSGKQPVNVQGAAAYKVCDEFNRVISEASADNEITSYAYDLLGKLTRVTYTKPDHQFHLRRYGSHDIHSRSDHRGTQGQNRHFHL